jgi:hypothetical protein
MSTSTLPDEFNHSLVSKEETERGSQIIVLRRISDAFASNQATTNHFLTGVLQSSANPHQQKSPSYVSENSFRRHRKPHTTLGNLLE